MKLTTDKHKRIIKEIKKYKLYTTYRAYLNYLIYLNSTHQRNFLYTSLATYIKQENIPQLINMLKNLKNETITFQKQGFNTINNFKKYYLMKP